MEDRESFTLDTDDVREQLEQQRVLAAQLREKLEHDEQQLASKEQQNEILKSKLSLLKSRSKAKRNIGAGDKDERNPKSRMEQNISSQRTHDSNPLSRKHAQNTVNKGKMNILREQLEQNRLRFERHGQELSEDTRSVEAMVEQLRHQLEERDVTIQQLQAGQLSPDNLGTEEMISEPVDLGTQLSQKEEQVQNLLAQVSHYQNTILELQENLKEKDCVIEARTQAISLLSEDMSKKWRANVDMLEETRQQMQMMQENFVRIEGGLNAEIEHLNQQLSHTSEKLSQADKSIKISEAARIDLENQNSELLKEIKNLQALQQGASTHEDARSKIDELTQALSEANKLTVKLKAEHKAKVKTLNKQIDSLRKESDVNCDLVQLQNHIAELEEEKGNLQLHLLEIEESTGMQEQKINELEKIISEQENKNISAEQIIAELEVKHSTLDQEISELKQKLEDRENEIIHLKELLDSESKSKSNKQSDADLENELEEVRGALREWQCRYEALEKQLQDWNEGGKQQTNVPSCLDPTQDHVSSIEELRAKVASYEKDLAIKVELLERASHEKQLQVQELMTVVQSNIEKIESFASISPEIPCCKCENREEVLIEKTKISSDQEAEINLLKQSLDELKEKNAILNRKLACHGEEHTASRQLEVLSRTDETCETITDLQRKLTEVTGELELKTEECFRLETKLKAQVEKAKKIAVNLKVKTVANKDLEERVGRYESTIQNIRAEMDQLVREKQDILEKWQTEMSEKDAALNQVAENLALRELDVQNLKEQLDCKSSSLLEAEEKLSASCKCRDELQLTISEKCDVINKLTLEIDALRSQINSEIEERQAALSKLESFTKQAKLKLAKEKKVRSEMVEKQNELEALIAEKSCTLADVLAKHAREIEQVQREKESLQTLLVEHQHLVAALRQELECEKNKLQFANESIVTDDEQTEETEDLHPLPSLETFQSEVEDLCISVGAKTSHEVLPILEEEKLKTMNELSSSFELLHTQIIHRLQNRPDVHADRKLLTELRNLVTRVINRTTALENKIKQVVSESNSQIQRQLTSAEKKLESLQMTLSESAEHLNVKETERLNLENAVNDLNSQLCVLTQQLQQENQKSHDLEIKFRETCDQLDASIQTANNLQQESHAKDITIQDLQSKFSNSLAMSEQVQQELFTLQQQNFANKADLDKLSELQQTCEEIKQEKETWKSKLIITEEELSKANFCIQEMDTKLTEALIRCESLQDEIHNANRKASDLQEQFNKAIEEKEALQHELSDIRHAYSLLQQEISEKSETSLHQSSSWASEKEQYEHRISDLMNQLHSSHPQLPINEAAKESEEVLSLRQHLAEKTAEVENYQQRLMQLQMGTLNSNSLTFGLLSDNQQLSQVISPSEKVSVSDTMLPSQSNVSNSNDIFDAFKPASSLFETPSEVGSLQEKIRNLSEQIELLSFKNTSLETEKINLQANLENVNVLLNTAQSGLEAARSDCEAFKIKIAELTSTVERAETCVEQEKFNAQKLEDDMKALQWKLENEKFNKDKAIDELKCYKEKATNELRLRREAERPSIPQSLDTHVSSLQSSGSAFSSEENAETINIRTDESLMECNITQLESELFGMVTSLQETTLKQKTMEDCWIESSKSADPYAKDIHKEENQVVDKKLTENADSLKHIIHQLKEKLTVLEAEKNDACSKVEALQAHIKTLPQSSPETDQIASQVLLSVSDPLMTEDDSWGWGSDSAHLEVQHQELRSQNQPSSHNTENDLKYQMDSLRSDYELLEKEKLQLADDLKSSQIRAAKLTRKLRDLKSKYDEMSDKNRSTDSPFDSLDQAIEEERMKQMQVLEKNLKEVQTELATVKAERDRLQKQVDVFSAANDRMLETKERQDVEVEMWQKRSKDLSNQVEALEWKIRELEERGEERPSQEAETGSGSPLKKQPESVETLNPVEINQLLTENHTWNSNYENLMLEYQKLRAQCLADSEQRTQVDAVMAQQKGMIERLEHEKAYFQDVYDSLKMDYEAACAQLALKQVGEDETIQHARKTEELEEKLRNLEKQLEDTVAQLQAMASDKAQLQIQCDHLSKTKDELLHQIEECQSRLQGNAQEIIGLQEKIREFEERRAQEIIGNTSANYASLPGPFAHIHGTDNSSQNFSPVHEVFLSHEAAVQSSTANSSVLNWNSVVPNAGHSSVDIFGTIANNSAQSLEDQLKLKENEMQKDKRMIETLKRTHEESEQEWSQIIEYHKSQLETAKKTVNDLQLQLDSLKLGATNSEETINLKIDFNNQLQINEQLQNIIFAKEKEIESLQINLAVSEQLKSKLEEELQNKQTELSKVLDQQSHRLKEELSLLEAPSSTSHEVSAESVRPPYSTSDKNLSNELDLALNMLYERDVRCEELTQELTRLLEERDSLQLRLSNAIRTNEKLREQLKQLLPSQSDDLTTNMMHSLQGHDQQRFDGTSSDTKAVGTSSTHDYVAVPEENQLNLENKLAELRKIGYSHDKWLREDSEYRHQQQMRLLSPSPSANLSTSSGLPNDQNTSVEVMAPNTAFDAGQDSSSNEPNTAEQSSSNETQGSLLSWLWGRS